MYVTNGWNKVHSMFPFRFKLETKIKHISIGLTYVGSKDLLVLMPFTKCAHI